MRTKLAKLLRRIARNHTTGLPERAYKINRQGTVILDSACTRAAYQQLKKQIRSTN
jgi:hypothetical protein